MKISDRLQHIANMIPKCTCLADIGTDHGYIPIFCILNGVCKKAIASDINKGPVEAANKNIKRYEITGGIDTRVGPGLSTLAPGEADVIVIAGMGGNLIADIIEEDMLVAEKADVLILQPVQYPEVLRKYLHKKGFKIIDEDLVCDGEKYYQIIKASKGEDPGYKSEASYYIGKILIDKGGALLKEYLEHKITKLNIILKSLEESKDNSRYREVVNLKEEFEEVMKCL